MLRKKEIEKRTRYFLFLTIAKITSEIMIIIGFFIFIYFVIRVYG